MVTGSRSSCDNGGLRTSQRLQRLNADPGFFSTIHAFLPRHSPCSFECVAWHPGDHLSVRGSDWRVVHNTAYADCTALDLASVEGPPVFRTVLLPFDRPRRAPVPRLTVLSPRLWSEHVGTRLVRTFPYGGLRFCPCSIELLAYQLEPALAVFRHFSTRVLIGDDVGLGKTVEAGVIVREMVGRRATARVLVIVPAALRAQWKA